MQGPFPLARLDRHAVAVAEAERDENSIEGAHGARILPGQLSSLLRARNGSRRFVASSTARTVASSGSCGARAPNPRGVPRSGDRGRRASASKTSSPPTRTCCAASISRRSAAGSSWRSASSVAAATSRGGRCCCARTFGESGRLVLRPCAASRESVCADTCHAGFERGDQQSCVRRLRARWS